MPVVGIGIDLIEASRIENALRRFGERFLKRVYTDGELSYCFSKARPSLYLAARFAAKEAVSKALGNYKRGLSWKDIEILNDIRGRPSIKLSNKIRITRPKGEKILISISHTKDVAIAQAILVKG